MKTGTLIITLLVGLALSGCDGGEKPMSKEEAQKKIFAPTDVNGMSPAMKAKVPANGLGPVSGQNGPPAGFPSTESSAPKGQ